MPKQPLVNYAGYIQLPITPGAIEDNLASLRHALYQLQPPRKTVLLLPELWATGFAYDALPSLSARILTLYEELQDLASKYDVLLAGSLPESSPEKEGFYYNTLQIIDEDGSAGIYRKVHLFPGEERAFIEAPRYPSPIKTALGIFGCLICYDLRFPGLARSQCQQGADMLVCAAQWPATRSDHFRALVISRAIENQTYVVACNGVGENGGVRLGGHSLIVSPEGEVLSEAGGEAAGDVIALQWPLQEEVRSRFRSFSVSSWNLLAKMKIITSDVCLEETERRWRAGQRIVMITLSMDEIFACSVEKLEKARMLGDHLIVAMDPGVDRQEGTNSGDTASLVPYAALGSVGSIFFLDAIATPFMPRLQQYCHMILR